MRVKSLLLFLLLLTWSTAHAQHHFKVLHAFGDGTDGAGVWDSVTLDLQGSIYGTTSGGGAYGYGSVFELSPESNGRWNESVLQSFKPLDPNGAEPNGGLVLNSVGNLYGTTQAGGKYGVGTTFRLSRSRRGWSFAVIHNFGGPGDPACCPWGNLIMDHGGNLYGTGYAAFALSPGPKGWTEAILHSFTGKRGDGAGPQAGPIRDAAGNLYGTTLYGGGSKVCADGCGTVWELKPPVSDDTPGVKAWTEHILHRFGFSDNDGVFPGVGQLAMDAAGNLYGTANGGKYRSGVVFKLSRVAVESTFDEVWHQTILYSFTGAGDGSFPEGVILGKTGNLYGIAGAGGGTGNGVVFKLMPQADGSWKYVLLHTFLGSDGAEPVANLTFGPDGKLYGTAPVGGPHGGGVVFQLTP
jgi:uncharacterized repeat protein (TIGR03803 family)